MVKPLSSRSGGDAYPNLSNLTSGRRPPGGDGTSTISARYTNDTFRRLECTIDTERASEAVRRLVNGINPQDFA